MIKVLKQVVYTDYIDKQCTIGILHTKRALQHSKAYLLSLHRITDKKIHFELPAFSYGP